jgi:hypothetical protein
MPDIGQVWTLNGLFYGNPGKVIGQYIAGYQTSYKVFSQVAQ